MTPDIWALPLFAAAAVAAAMATGKGGPATPSIDAKGGLPGAAAWLATALKVAPERVSGAVAVPAAHKETILVGVVAGDAGAQRAALVIGQPCAKKAGGAGNFCARGELRGLDEADGSQALTVEALGFVDLAAAPKSVPLAAAPLALPARSPRPMHSPALLLRTRRELDGPGGKHRNESLILVAIPQSEPPAIRLKQPGAARAPSGAGFETTELQLELPKAGAESAPDVVLVQHALPGKTDPEQMPGPPLTIRLRAASAAAVYQIIAP